MNISYPKQLKPNISWTISYAKLKHIADLYNIDCTGPHCLKEYNECFTFANPINEYKYAFKSILACIACKDIYDRRDSLYTEQYVFNKWPDVTTSRYGYKEKATSVRGQAEMRQASARKFLEQSLIHTTAKAAHLKGARILLFNVFYWILLIFIFDIPHH